MKQLQGSEKNIMTNSNKKSSKSVGIGLFSIPANYEEMTQEEQQQVLTDLMRQVGKRVQKMD